MYAIVEIKSNTTKFRTSASTLIDANLMAENLHKAEGKTFGVRSPLATKKREFVHIAG